GGGGGGVWGGGGVGMGRTAMWRAVERAARDCGADVRWVRASPQESAVPFAAAADLLLPMRAGLGSLPPVQRESLEASLALAGGDVQPLATCAGALGLLAAAGARRPVVVLVDDYQWLGEASRTVVAFSARRPAAR